MFEPGTQVGRYEIQRRLGRGGMGTVYVAHDPVLGRMVAIKIFAGDLDVPDARERFSREARAAAALNHPHIVTVYDFGEYNAQPYIVMEYVAGETMANIIRRKISVSLADKLRWMEELCSGAGYAHQMQVIHRDIKPANLIIDRSGRLKILDFGIARMLGIASNTSVMIGTPGYMAPEQITGDAVDHRADQFSIGVVFYELMAYAEPFPGDTLPMITHKIVSEEPTALEQLVPDVSPEIVSIVNQALKKKSVDRFKDSEALRIAIARVRRQYESDTDWNTPTIAAGRDVTPGGGSRGTGSARRRSSDSVGVAQLTPPPDPRRTDREALARRRTAQIDAAIMLARTLFEQKHFDEALDACEQALTLDEMHQGALELEQEIHTAIRIREGVEVAADDAASAAALAASEGPTMADFGPTASRMLESQAMTRLNEEAFAVTGLPPATSERPLTQPPAVRPSVSVPLDERTVVRPPSVGIPDEKTAIRPAAIPDATVVAPARRTPPAVPAQTAAPLAQTRVAPPVTKPPQTPGKVALKPAPRPKAFASALQSVASVVQSIGPALAGASQTLRGSVSGGAVDKRVQKQHSYLMWATAGVVVLAIAGGVGYLLTRGPAPTGTTIIEAVPWANVTEVRNESGEVQPLPSPASTPLALALPAGSYQITLTGPAPESKTETVTVRVDVGGTTVAPVARFQSMSVEEYFEQYIGAGDAPAPEAAPAPASPPAAAPSSSIGAVP
jgi:hypothetical protein